MEKVIYTATTEDPIDPVPLAEALMMAGAMRVRVNRRDADVAPADPLIQQRGETLPDVVVQLWLDSANPMRRAGVDAVVAAHTKLDGIAAWLGDKLDRPLDILPNVSAFQLACARFRQPWQDITIA